MAGDCPGVGMKNGEYAPAPMIGAVRICGDPSGVGVNCPTSRSVRTVGDEGRWLNSGSRVDVVGMSGRDRIAFRLSVRVADSLTVKNRSISAGTNVRCCPNMDPFSTR